MKYEEILRWREDVFQATVIQPLQLATQASLQGGQAAATTPRTARHNMTWSVDTVMPLQVRSLDVTHNMGGGVNIDKDGDNDPDLAPASSASTLVDMMSSIPVPASLAPAAGQAPSILKRPVSASFSSADVPAAALRATSGSVSTAVTSESSPPNYAYGHGDLGYFQPAGIDLSLPGSKTDLSNKAIIASRQKVSRVG